MNRRGSYRRFRDNAIAAMLAAIEVYNKPRFAYRDEVVVILLLNSWELLLKAMVSRSGGSVFYRKKKGQPYRSLSLADALSRARNSSAWPDSVSAAGVAENLESLGTYRNNAVHFYNAPGFGSVVYALTQTAVINFKDVLSEVFSEDLTKEITWQLLPLGVRAPVDPIRYLSGRGMTEGDRTKPVQEFLGYLRESASRLEADGGDLGRFMTVFDVHLQSQKKISASDVVVGIGAADDDDAVIVPTKVDPNRSHPLRQKDVLERLKHRGPQFNARGWQALVWAEDLKAKPHLCWTDESTRLVKWSPEAVAVAAQLTDREMQDIRARYSRHLALSRG